VNEAKQHVEGGTANGIEVSIHNVFDDDWHGCCR